MKPDIGRESRFLPTLTEFTAGLPEYRRLQQTTVPQTRSNLPHIRFHLKQTTADYSKLPQTGSNLPQTRFHLITSRSTLFAVEADHDMSIQNAVWDSFASSMRSSLIWCSYCLLFVSLQYESQHCAKRWRRDVKSALVVFLALISLSND